jgi:hypothetical protein
MKTARSLRAWALALAIPLAAAAQQNPAARRGPADFDMLAGTWNGANIETRSNCTSPQNNGFHGTYAENSISHGAASTLLIINETTTSGLFCNYTGTYVNDRPLPKWTGTLSCSDGKRATFESTNFLITPNEMQVRLHLKLFGSETCDVDSILGGSRF